jgi:hypothetical protein
MYQSFIYTNNDDKIFLIAPALQRQHDQEQEVLTNLNERLAYYVKVNKLSLFKLKLM